MLARLAGMGPDAFDLARAVVVLGPGSRSRTQVALAGRARRLELVADEVAAAQILTAARPLDFFIR